MKYLSAFILATGLAVGLAASAHAAPDYAYYADRETVVVDSEAVGHPHHKCHGASAGTADRACSSATGGPAGGLH